MRPEANADIYLLFPLSVKELLGQVEIFTRALDVYLQCFQRDEKCLDFSLYS